ncbi:MAG: DUF4111 domain-containing protein [Anaerolineales bacterium]
MALRIQSHHPERMKNPTPYPELNGVLREFTLRIQNILQSNFIGAYLQGSFAVGGFDQHSDVDFIVATDERLSSHEVDALQVLHDRIYHLDSEWAKHLEGSYFPKEILRDYTKEGMDLWYLDHGARSLIRSDHCNTILVRWVVRDMGVPLAGPAPKELVDPIPTERLREDIYQTLMEWGQQILDDPSPYENRFYQGFIVLNYCRMLHDLHQGVPGSKQDGAAWAKQNLDPAWSPLIEAAWTCRPDPAKQVQQPPDPQAFKKILKFVQHIMIKSESFMKP